MTIWEIWWVAQELVCLEASSGRADEKTAAWNREQTRFGREDCAALFNSMCGFLETGSDHKSKTLWGRKQRLILKVETQLETSVTRIWEIIGSRSSEVPHELLDGKRFGCIREALKLDKREHGRETLYFFHSFDSHREHLQVTGSIPVQQIMFHRLRVRLCISNQKHPGCILYWC